MALHSTSATVKSFLSTKSSKVRMPATGGSLTEKNSCVCLIPAQWSVSSEATSQKERSSRTSIASSRKSSSEKATSTTSTGEFEEHMVATGATTPVSPHLRQRSTRSSRSFSTRWCLILSTKTPRLGSPLPTWLISTSARRWTSRVTSQSPPRLSATSSSICTI